MYKTFAELNRLDLGEERENSAAPLVLFEADGQVHRPTSAIDRPAQWWFRGRVQRAFGLATVVTGEVCREVLDAAHVQPSVDRRSGDERNRIAPRTDLHAPFDAALPAADEELQLLVSPRLHCPACRALDAAALKLPERASKRPASDSLAVHRTAVFRKG